MEEGWRDGGVEHLQQRLVLHPQAVEEAFPQLQQLLSRESA